MGASKIDVKKLSRIIISEFCVDSFKLLRSEICKFSADALLEAGDVVLIKASFKNPCEDAIDESKEFEDGNVLYRRRVVPFVTRVRRVGGEKRKGRRLVTAKLESITPGDKKFFYDKFFSSDPRDRAALDIEGRRIVFGN